MSFTERLQPAFVLHRRDYRNTSLLLDVYSRDYGRLSLVAKGARRKKGSGPLLQPFAPLLMSWQGRGELRTLTGTESAVQVPALQAGALLCGFYLNELLQRLLARDDPDAGLFMDYAQTLRALADAKVGDGPVQSQAMLLRRFELRLLSALGYALVLDHCVSDGSAIDARRRYRYWLEQGPVAEGGDGAPMTTPGDGIPISGRTLLGLADGRLDASGQREALYLLRAALAPHLGDRPLHSRQLYAQYLKLRG